MRSNCTSSIADFKKNQSGRQTAEGCVAYIYLDKELFTEAINGDMLQIEDNTEADWGFIPEPVSNGDQQLDDAQLFLCRSGQPDSH